MKRSKLMFQVLTILIFLTALSIRLSSQDGVDVHPEEVSIVKNSVKGIELSYSGSASQMLMRYSGGNIGLKLNSGSMILNNSSGNIINSISAFGFLGYNAGGNVTTALVPISTGDGGSLTLNNSSQANRIIFLAEETNGAGALGRLFNRSNVSTLELDADGIGSGAELRLKNSAGNTRLRLYAEASTTEGAKAEFFNSANKSTVVIDAEASGNASFIQLNDNDEQRKIFLDADGEGAGGEIWVCDDQGRNRVEIYGEEFNNNGSAIYLMNAAGAKTIELDADLSGNGRVITDEIQIKGGSDLSEQFDVYNKEEILPGMVVSIDPTAPGRLIVSEESYDKKIAGVVSGANGIKSGLMMGQEGSLADGEHPIAMIGRVYVLADAKYGAINPGDLLTSSKTLGYAMKVKNHRKAKGAIVGKAMEELESGTGYILILINLQ